MIFNHFFRINLSKLSFKALGFIFVRFILARFVFALGAIALISACQKSAPSAEVAAVNLDDASFITEAKPQKTLRVVTQNGANTYFTNSDNEYAGLEYELAQLFVKELGADYKLELIVVDHFSDVIPTLLAKKADIAAADITITDARKSVVQFSTPYLDVQQQVAYNREFTTPPRNLKALKNQTLVVPYGSSFVDRLKKVSQKNPQIHYDEIVETSSEKLIESLAKNEIVYTVANDHMLSLMQYHYPNIGKGFSIGEPEKIAWALRKDGDPFIAKKAAAFFAKIKKNGVLRNLVDRYHGNTKRLNPFDVKSFMAMSETRLPKYVHLFKSAQETTNIDWRLLASISYQESHWDTLNTSPTNVRGLMMLTEATSDLMKVTNRLDPKQSVPAGAKFFLWLKDRLPERVAEPDRTYMALASYNIGFGHLEDARVLAQRLGLNPDSWVDIKKTFVMLTEPKYYAKAKYGYCDCGAPVIYTESIRSYYQIIQKMQPPHNPNDTHVNLASNAL